MPRPKGPHPPVPAAERIRKSLSAHKSAGGADKHWRLSREAVEALRFLLRESPAVTERALIERLLLEERARRGAPDGDQGASGL